MVRDAPPVLALVQQDGFAKHLVLQRRAIVSSRPSEAPIRRRPGPIAPNEGSYSRNHGPRTSATVQRALPCRRPEPVPRLRPRVAEPPAAGLSASSLADWGVESPSASPMALIASTSGLESAFFYFLLQSPDRDPSRSGRGAPPMSLTTRFPATRKLCDEAQALVDELVTGRDAGQDRESAASERVNALSAEVAALRRSLSTDPLGKQEAWQQCAASGPAWAPGRDSSSFAPAGASAGALPTSRPRARPFGARWSATCPTRSGRPARSASESSCYLAR